MEDNNESAENNEFGEEATLPSFSVKSRESRHPMEFLLKIGAPALMPKVGDMIKGVVLEKRGTRIFIDLGQLGTGIIYGREYYAAEDMVKHLNSGDEVHAKIVELDNEEGYMELSLKEAGAERRWLDLRKLLDEKSVLELPVLEANRGGLILEAENIKGFLPASQLSSKHYPRVEGGDKEKIYQELQKLIGQAIKVKILDLNQAENKLIFTEKGLDYEALKETLTKYKVGDEVEGEVTGVVDFGAFMKFDEEAGIEGLIHKSEIDWTLVQDPLEVIKPGERVRAKIIEIQGDKVSLSLKQLKPDPWVEVAQKHKKGDVVRGLITKFNPFGAFVELDKGVQGLLHISEFGTESRMREILELGKEYDLKILMLDPQEHRMSLGLIHSDDSEVTPPKDEPAADAAQGSLGLTHSGESEASPPKEEEKKEGTNPSPA